MYRPVCVCVSVCECVSVCVCVCVCVYVHVYRKWENEYVCQLVCVYVCSYTDLVVGFRKQSNTIDGLYSTRLGGGGGG